MGCLFHNWGPWRKTSGPPDSMRAPKWQGKNITEERVCKKCKQLDWKINGKKER